MLLVLIEFGCPLLLAPLMNSCLQVPFYLAELTEKVSQGDRIQILRASQAKLKVNDLQYLKNWSKLCYVQVFY